MEDLVGLEGWRAIETAPTIGHMLVFHERHGEDLVSEAFRFDNGKFGLATFNGSIMNCEPTHWRPLPASPTAAPSKATGEEDCPLCDGQDLNCPVCAAAEARRSDRKNAPLSQQMRTDGEQSPRPVATDQNAAANTSGATLTAAAPAPGRGGDGPLPDEVIEKAWRAMGPVTMTGTGDMEGAIKAAVRALARHQPTRLEGGVTQEQVEAALDSWFIARVIDPEKGDPYEEARGHMREALEAAASTAPSDAGGKEGRS